MFHEAARQFLGVPFEHQGRSRSGLDCIGLLVLSAMACGSPVRDRADYPRDPSREQLESGMDAHFIRVPKSELRAGDLVGIDFKGVVRHVGIIGQHPEYQFSLIHTSSQVGRVIEHGVNEKWMRRIKIVWRPESPE